MSTTETKPETPIVHQLVQPSDLISELTENPILSDEDVNRWRVHGTESRELVLLVRKRASERMAALINEMAAAAQDIADDLLNS